MEQRLFELLHQCTMHISVPGKTGHGSGFFVAPGLILTCAHVLKAAQSDLSPITIYWNGQSYPAQITKLQQDHDLALLQVHLSDHPCVYLHEEAIPFDALYSYGYPDDYPSGDPATFTLEGRAGEQGEQLKFKTGQVRPGLSGAPLLNVRTGYVCGVVQLTRDRNNDLGGRAIPAPTVLRVFPQLASQQRQFHQQDGRWTSCLWEIAARTRYLEGIARRFSSITLPIDATTDFALQAVFQPLKLRRDPLTAEDLTYDKRRQLLGEFSRSKVALHRFWSIEENKEGLSGTSEYEGISGAPVLVSDWNSIGMLLPAVIADGGEDALNKSSQRRIIILGGPGTGKTTVLGYLIGNQAQQAKDDPSAQLPIFISLPDFARSGKTFQEYLLFIIKSMRTNERYAEVLWKAIEDGQAFVCLDGLDEVAPKERPQIIRLINELASESSNTWIIGSRFTEYKGGQFRRGQFTEWEIQPLDHTLRQQLAQGLIPKIHQLLRGTRQITNDESSVFVRQLEAHPRASAWGENPLLFSIAAVVFVSTGMLPSSRTLLYQQITNVVLETREPDPTRKRMLRYVLADLALELYRTRGRTFTRDDLLILLPEVRERQHENWPTEEMVDRIVTSGVLDVVAHETYGFSHQTFQEYLAAVGLAQRLVSQDQETRENSWSFAWGKRTYSRWTEILRLMVGVLVQEHRKAGVQRLEQWLRKLVGQRATPDGDPGDLGLALAVKSLAEIAQPVATRSKEVEEVIEEVLMAWVARLLEVAGTSQAERLEALAPEVTHLGTFTTKVVERLVAALDREQGYARRTVLYTFGGLGAYAPIERLMTALGDKDSFMRFWAAEALGRLGEHVPVERLVALLKNPDVSVREAAAQALGYLGERAPLEPLLKSLEDEAWQVREAATDALRFLGERAPVESLVSVLSDPDPSVRAIAALALGELGERAPVDPLVTALADPDAFVRRRALGALGQMGDRAPVEQLKAALDDDSSEVRLAAAEVLGQVGAVEPLLAAINDNDIQVRSEALKALGQQGKHIPTEILKAALNDEEEFIRRLAMEAVGSLRNTIFVNELITTLDDRIGWIRAATTQILGSLEEHSPIDTLEIASCDEDPHVRAAAVRALGQQGERAPMKRLIDALDDPDWKVRLAAVEALERQKGPLPVERLITMLNDNAEPVALRVAVVEALGRLGKQAPVEHLLLALDDQIGSIRAAATGTLWQLVDRVPMDRLCIALNDADWKVRAAAANALGHLKELAPIERLVAGLDDKNESVRVAVIEALGMLGERAPLEPLLAALKDMSMDVRSAAVEMLGKLGERAPLEPLLAALEDREWEVHVAAVEALGQLGARTPVERLIAALDDSGDSIWWVRRAAAEALGKQEERAPVKRLIAALDDSNSAVRIAVAQALVNLGQLVPTELLMDVLRGGGDLRERAEAALILGELKVEAATEELVSSLGDSNEVVRNAVARVLSQQYPDVLPLVISEATAVLMRKEAGPVFGSLSRGFIAELIGYGGQSSPALVEKLTSLFSWHYWEVRMKAAEALGNLQRNIPDESIRRLLDLRHDPKSPAVREAADFALADILSLETGIEDD
jgi:HEAT repeat protein